MASVYRSLEREVFWATGRCYESKGIYVLRPEAPTVKVRGCRASLGSRDATDAGAAYTLNPKLRNFGSI